MDRTKLTFAESFDGEEIKLGVLRGTDLWHEVLEHPVALVGGVVHQDLIPDHK